MRAIKLTIIIFCCIAGVASAGEIFIPSSNVTGIKFTSSSSIDTVRLNSLIRNGYLSLKTQIKIPGEAKSYIDTAVTFCEKNNIDIPPRLNLLKAEYLFTVGDYRSSEEEAIQSMEKAKNSGENDVLARTMLFLGKYYLRTGFYKESIDYFGKAIALSEQMGLEGIIPKGYEGLSGVYNSVGDLNGYRQSLQLMIDAALAGKDTLYSLIGYIRLGTSFSDKNRNFRKADSLLRRYLEISIIRKDTFYTGFALANIGWNFYTLKMYDSSLFYYNKSLRYSIPGKQYSVSSNSLGNIGTIYRDLGNTDLSISYYRRSIDEAKKANDIYSLSWVHDDMSKMYLMKKDTANAFKSFVLFKQFSDSLMINKNSQGMSDAKVRYEADTQNKEVQLLSLKLKNQRLLNYGFTGFIILTITIGLLLWRGSKLKTKRRISEMNRQISEITQANLRQQMNPHFIFNTLNSIQYYMYQHDKLATNNYLTKFSSLMRKVLENSQHTSVSLRDELDALNLYLDLECLRFKDKFDYEIRVDEEIDTLMFKVPTMLIQPYVENSICHGLMPREGKGFIKIDLKLEKDHIICIIEDNGIGREAAQERKKLRAENHNSLGTQIVSSRLDLVNTLYGTNLKTTYADLTNENGEPEGTRVEIHIPIMT